ncbi:MAG: response regulator transcription factor [Gallionella sp.]|nr:response regulator transcription factor [Gallionella sp.]
MLRVIHADDREMMRHAIARFMLHNPNIMVVAQASSGNELLQKLQVTETDLVLADWNMPGVDGEELIGCIRSKFPLVYILVHSADDDTLTRNRALNAGASSFISKNCPPNILLRAILGTA